MSFDSMLHVFQPIADWYACSQKDSTDMLFDAASCCFLAVSKLPDPTGSKR